MGKIRKLLRWLFVGLLCWVLYPIVAPTIADYSPFHLPESPTLGNVYTASPARIVQVVIPDDRPDRQERWSDKMKNINWNRGEDVQYASTVAANSGKVHYLASRLPGSGAESGVESPPLLADVWFQRRWLTTFACLAFGALTLGFMLGFINGRRKRFG
jgi:hypothetical protein